MSALSGWGTGPRAGPKKRQLGRCPLTIALVNDVEREISDTMGLVRGVGVDTSGKMYERV